jgi:hypothetical protein
VVPRIGRIKMTINNCADLWFEWMGGEETEETSKALLKKWVFKGTECGCVFKSDEKGIKVGGYNELGESAELPTYDLKWGFTLNAFKEALDYADADGVEAWHEANEDDWSEAYASLDMITEEEWNEENNKTDA